MRGFFPLQGANRCVHVYLIGPGRCHGNNQTGVVAGTGIVTIASDNVVGDDSLLLDRINIKERVIKDYWSGEGKNELLLRALIRKDTVRVPH